MTENEIRVVIIDDDEGVLDVLGEAVTAERDRRGRRRVAAA